MECQICKIVEGTLRELYNNCMCDECYDKENNITYCKADVKEYFNLKDSDLVGVNHTTHKNSYRGYSHIYRKKDIMVVFKQKYKDILTNNVNNQNIVYFVDGYLSNLKEEKKSKTLNKLLSKYKLEEDDIPYDLVNDFLEGKKNSKKEIVEYIEIIDKIEYIKKDKRIIDNNIDVNKELSIIKMEKTIDETIDIIIKKYDDERTKTDREKNIKIEFEKNNIKYEELNMSYKSLYNDYINKNNEPLENIIETITKVKDRRNKLSDRLEDNGVSYDSSIYACEEFYDNYVKNNKITIDDCVNQIIYYTNRKKELIKKLEENGLRLRNDSELCRKFINGVGDLMYVVNTMVEMDWYYNHTNYSGILQRKYSRNNYYDYYDKYSKYYDDSDDESYNKYDRSEEAKDEAITNWIKNKNYTNKPPPSLNNKILMYEQFYYNSLEIKINENYNTRDEIINYYCENTYLIDKNIVKEKVESYLTIEKDKLFKKIVSKFQLSDKNNIDNIKNELCEKYKKFIEILKIEEEYFCEIIDEKVEEIKKIEEEKRIQQEMYLKKQEENKQRRIADEERKKASEEKRNQHLIMLREEVKKKMEEAEKNGVEYRGKDGKCVCGNLSSYSCSKNLCRICCLDKNCKYHY